MDKFILLWVFSVLHPDGTITDRLETTAPTYTDQVACEAKANYLDSLDLFRINEVVTQDGGKLRYSKWWCVRVPPDGGLGAPTPLVAK